MKLKFGGGKVELDMMAYLLNVLEEFPIKFDGHKMVVNPAGVDMFEEGNRKVRWRIQERTVPQNNGTGLVLM